MNKIILISLISYSQAVKIRNEALSQLGAQYDLDGIVAAAEETVDQTVETVVETTDAVVTSTEAAVVE